MLPTFIKRLFSIDSFAKHIKKSPESMLTYGDTNRGTRIEYFLTSYKSSRIRERNTSNTVEANMLRHFKYHLLFFTTRFYNECIFYFRYIVLKINIYHRSDNLFDNSFILHSHIVILSLPRYHQ